MLVLVRPFARWVLNQAGSKVEAVQTPLFVEFVKLLVDPQAGRKVGKGRIESRKSVAEYLLERGLYQLLGKIIKSVVSLACFWVDGANRVLACSRWRENRTPRFRARLHSRYSPSRHSLRHFRSSSPPLQLRLRNASAPS